MFSRRTPASYTLNPLTRAVAERREAGLPLIDLTVTNPTRAGIDYPSGELLAALHDPRSLTYEPAALGHEEARRAVAAWHGGLNPDRLVLAGSTSEAYGWLFKLLCDPGESVLAPRPSYPLFDCLAALDSVRLEHYTLVEAEGWSIDFDGLERTASPGVRAIILVNPNNPTGSYIHKEDWARLLALAARRDWAIISDEVFFDYQWRPVARRSGIQAQSEALVFTLSGLSKSIGLPQMKLGWIYAAGPDVLLMEAFERLEWIADAYLPVSAPVQHAASCWLETGRTIQESIRQRCLASMDVLRQAAARHPELRLHEPEAGWSAVIEAPRLLTDEQWAIELVNAGFLVQPGYFYDFERDGRLVVSLLANPEDLMGALEALGGIVRRIS